MSQLELLEAIRTNPGIMQRDIHKKTGMVKQGVSTQILALVRKGEIKRIPTANQRTYELYAVEV